MSSLIVTVLIGFFFHFCEFIFAKLKKNFASYVFYRLRVLVNFNLTLLIFCSNFDTIVLFSTLQMRALDFTDPTNTASIFFSLAMIGAGVGLIILVIKLIKESRRLKAQLLKENSKTAALKLQIFIKKWEGFQVLFMGFKEKSVWTHCFLLIFLSRMLVF